MLGTQRGSCGKFVAVLSAVKEVVATVLAAAEEGDILHGGGRKKRADWPGRSRTDRGEAICA